MQIPIEPLGGRGTTPYKYDDLLLRRMTIAGLDSGAIECEYGEAFDKIGNICTNCRLHVSCAADLEFNPGNLLWEAYCPNSGALRALDAIAKAGGHRSCDRRDGSRN